MSNCTSKCLLIRMARSDVIILGLDGQAEAKMDVSSARLKDVFVSATGVSK